MESLLSTCAGGWGIGLVILAGFHATWTIGVTGGPNHGEHPFIVNLLHLGVAGFWATRGWPSSDRWTYLSLVALAFVIGIAVIPLRAETHPRRVWTARVAMIAIYLQLLYFLFLGKWN